jgi:OmpA-OmpF porin, OOP family
MRCNPSYWLLGLVPIAMLSWVAVQFEHEGIEADLGRRTQEALTRSGMDWAAPIFAGRDGVLTGKASDESAPPRALTSMREAWGVRVAHNRAELLERVDKFFWSAASRGDGRVLLTGFVPNEDARKAVVSSAKGEFPKFEIIDEMKLARGAPDRDAWLAGTTFALKQLAQLKKGSTELDALDLSVIGEAGTNQAYKGVRQALATALPGGIKLAIEKITPPIIDPYTWSAKASAGQLAISGFAPSDQARKGVEAYAKKIFPKADVSDKSDLAGGAPEGFDKAVKIALEQLANLKSGSADLKGKEFGFQGDAADEASAAAVRKTIKSDVPQNFKIVEQIRYPKASQPVAAGYTISIAYDGTGIEVSGTVPSEAARSALIDAVKSRFPGRAVTDKLQVASGAPDGWQQCIIAGLAPLPRLSEGKTILVDRRLSVTGSTKDYGAAQNVPQEVKAAAGQACDAETKIAFTGELKNNLAWRAVHDESGALTLDGEVPDDATRARLIDAAQRLFPSARVADQMKILAAPPGPWLDVAVRGLTHLARLQRGEASLVGPDLTVKGLAANETIAGEVRSAIPRDLPSGFNGRDAIEVMSVEQQAANSCQDMMRDATARGILEFARAKADLTSESTETLKELAEIAQECPTFKIGIEGHTDAEGTDERNQRLSDRRAKAVAEFLSREGVRSDRLTTVGYGATRPISDNATAEGRARNRRIEFVVKVN